jgi:hypothetical protein
MAPIIELGLISRSQCEAQRFLRWRRKNEGIAFTRFYYKHLMSGHFCREW